MSPDHLLLLFAALDVLLVIVLYDVYDTPLLHFLFLLDCSVALAVGVTCAMVWWHGGPPRAFERIDRRPADDTPPLPLAAATVSSQRWTRR